MIVTIYIIDDSKYLNGKQIILAFNFVNFFHKQNYYKINVQYSVTELIFTYTPAHTHQRISVSLYRSTTDLSDASTYLILNPKF